MTLPTFSEVIKVQDGEYCHLSYHAERVSRTTFCFFGKPIRFELSPEMIPVEMRSGLVKCRVVYSDRIVSIEFVPYSFKVIESVAVVHDDSIEYAYKSTDRSRLNQLLRESGCDEVIIIRNGCVTDTSLANLVFEDSTGLYTPATCLLSGTTRERLLRTNIISERTIRVEELSDYRNVYLINAMNGLEDKRLLPLNPLLAL